MLGERDWVFFSVTAMENKKSLPGFDPGRQRCLQFVQQVASFAGRFFLSGFHKFTPGMAVNAEHAPQLMNIRYQLMKLDTIRPEVFIFGGVRSPVFGIEIVLESTIVIKADIIAVMA